MLGQLIFFFSVLVFLCAIALTLFVTARVTCRRRFDGEPLFRAEDEFFPLDKKFVVAPFTEKKFEPKYTQKIPFNIIQTNLSREVGCGMNYTIQRNLEVNPEYDHYFFNDEEAQNFIATHFDERTVQSYNTLYPGAFKADLFRLCALYVMGGVYLDSGMGFLRPLREFIGENDEIILCKDWSNLVLPGIGVDADQIYNAVMISTPGNPIFKYNIDIINDNVEGRKYPSVFEITGPASLMKSVLSHPDIKIKWLKHSLLRVGGDISGVVFDTQTKEYLMYCRYRGYREERRKFDIKPGYLEIYDKKCVYGEREIRNSEKNISVPVKKSGKTNFFLDYYNVPKKNKNKFETPPKIESSLYPSKKVLYLKNKGKYASDRVKYFAQLNGECDFEIITTPLDKNEIESEMKKRGCDYYFSDVKNSILPFRKMQEEEGIFVRSLEFES